MHSVLTKYCNIFIAVDDIAIKRNMHMMKVDVVKEELVFELHMRDDFPSPHSSEV